MTPIGGVLTVATDSAQIADLVYLSTMFTSVPTHARASSVKEKRITIDIAGLVWP
jgi:hypothetical protein